MAPATRGQRLQSIAGKKEIKGLLKRRQVWSDAIHKVKKNCVNDAHLNWSNGELKERITRIEEASACLNKIHMEIMCDFEEEKPENFGKEDDGRRII